jgi:hypothetical protein
MIRVDLQHPRLGHDTRTFISSNCFLHSETGREKWLAGSAPWMLWRAIFVNLAALATDLNNLHGHSPLYLSCLHGTCCLCSEALHTALTAQHALQLDQHRHHGNSWSECHSGRRAHPSTQEAMVSTACIEACYPTRDSGSHWVCSLWYVISLFTCPLVDPNGHCSNV